MMRGGRAFLAAGLVAVCAAAQDDADLYGIRAKWANEAELATTNLAPGELVVNEGEWSDLRVGDGETPGGVSVGASLLARMRGDPTLLHDIGGASAAEIKALLALSVADQSETVSQALASHAAATNNPHGVSAAQIGALTAADLPLASTSQTGMVKLVNSATSFSSVTALVPEALTRFAHGAVFSGGTYSANETYNAGDRVRSGWNFWECTADGTKQKTPSASSTNWRDMNIQLQLDAAADQAAEISATVEAQLARVDALEAELHDWPETCRLYWPDDYVTNHWDAGTSTIEIPTNFPTRRLELVVSDVGITNLTVNLPFWHPGRDTEIMVVITRTSSAPTNRYSAVRINMSSTSANLYTAYSNYCSVSLVYDAVLETWCSYPATLPVRAYWWGKNGARVNFPTDWPATVEEWVAEWEAKRAAAQSLFDL